MADVMGLGHGGDGAGDPPPPFRGNRGRHEEDVVPRKNTRGKAKNLKLAQEIAKKGGPLDLPFDKVATYTPVGTRNDYFTREVRIYMWNSIAFDKQSWKYVSPAEKNALEEHLKGKFDMEAVKRDREHRRLKGGIEAVIKKGYRDRKHDAKKLFIKFGESNPTPNLS